MSKCKNKGCGYTLAGGSEALCEECFNDRRGEECDAVKRPSHYDIFPGLEAIQVIAMICTKQEFYGYCKGNMLKYRLRAGNKDDLAQDIGKADMYLELYKKHKHLCKPRE